MTFSYKVYSVVRTIPKGTVMTYQEVAILAGSPLGYRAVGSILHKNPDLRNIPCHRVIRSNFTLSEGYINGGKEAQKKLLISEGVKFKGEMILKK